MTILQQMDLLEVELRRNFSRATYYRLKAAGGACETYLWWRAVLDAVVIKCPETNFPIGIRSNKRAATLLQSLVRIDTDGTRSLPYSNVDTNTVRSAVHNILRALDNGTLKKDLVGKAKMMRLLMSVPIEDRPEKLLELFTEHQKRGQHDE